MRATSGVTRAAGEREHQLVQPPHERRRDRRAARLRPASPGRTARCAQSAKALVGFALQPLHQRVLRIDLEDRLRPSGTFWPAAFSRRSRLPESSSSPTTRHAGESVSRCVTRTSFTRSPSAVCDALDQRLAARSASCLLLPSSPRRRRARPGRARPWPPTAAACPRTRSGSTTTHSSTRSDSSSTSMPFLRKISRCGLFSAAAKRVGGDVVDRLLARPSCAPT